MGPPTIVGMDYLLKSDVASLISHVFTQIDCLSGLGGY